MHTPNINCCRTLFFPTSGLLFIPPWQSWECLLGSPWCQASVGRRLPAAAPPASPAATCTAQAMLPSDYTWQGDWSQPRSAQCSTLFHSGATHQIGQSLWTALLSETPLPHPSLPLSSSDCWATWGTACPLLLQIFYPLSVFLHKKLSYFYLNICFLNTWTDIFYPLAIDLWIICKIT